MNSLFHIWKGHAKKSTEIWTLFKRTENETLKRYSQNGISELGDQDYSNTNVPNFLKFNRLI